MAASDRRRTLIALAAGTGAVAVVWALALAGLSSPENLKARLAALSTGAAAQQRLHRQSDRGGMVLPPAAVCGGSLAQAQEALRGRITASAQARGMRLESLSVGADPDAPLSMTLAPMRVRLQAEGGYDGAVHLMGDLAALRPTLFADTVDMSSKTSSVTLSVSGRVFCVG